MDRVDVGLGNAEEGFGVGITGRAVGLGLEGDVGVVLVGDGPGDAAGAVTTMERTIGVNRKVGAAAVVVVVDRVGAVALIVVGDLAGLGIVDDELKCLANRHHSSGGVGA